MVNSLLIDLTVDGLLPLQEIRKHNYPLFRYCRSNIQQVSSTLQDNGIKLIDTRHPMSLDTIREVLIYYNPAMEINLSKLRKDDRYIYNRLTAHPKGIRGILKEWGFKVKYNSDKNFIKELKNIAEDGVIVKLDKGLYNKVNYRARKEGLSIQDYLKSLGFMYSITFDRDNKILELYTEDITIKDIADRVGVSERTVYRVLNKYCKKDGQTVL